MVILKIIINFSKILHITFDKIEILTKKLFKIEVIYPLKYEFLFKRSHYCTMQFEFAQNLEYS
jgi:hypothetical protein